MSLGPTVAQPTACHRATSAVRAPERSSRRSRILCLARSSRFGAMSVVSIEGDAAFPGRLRLRDGRWLGGRA